MTAKFFRYKLRESASSLQVGCIVSKNKMGKGKKVEWGGNTGTELAVCSEIKRARASTDKG